MTKQEFKDLTGEDPEDMFGGDWENEVQELELTAKDIAIVEAKLKNDEIQN